MSEYLYTIPYSKFVLWDVKRYNKIKFQSKYSIELLGNHIVPETEKVVPYNSPDETFSILGISNEIGMYDAYNKTGKDFNQAYKIVKENFIAYNPYRINVGSIGIKKSTLKGNLISPAYVVFSCKDTILPDYLFLLMKTDKFNEQVKENTSGSVRQNLTFDALSRIEIPVPSIHEQNVLINEYFDKQKQIELLKNKHSYIQVENFIVQGLALKPIGKETEKNTISFTSFSNLFTWDVRNRANRQVLSTERFISKPLGSIAEINPSITKKLDNDDDVTFIPMECVSDLDGVVLENRNCKASDKGYTKFENGDIIWAKITPCMQNGKSAIVKDLINGVGYGSTEFYVIRVNENFALTEYIYFILRMHKVRNEAMNYFSGSAGQQRVRKSFLEELLIPLPSIQEQRDFVKKMKDMQMDIISNRKKIEDLELKSKLQFQNSIFE